MKLLYIIWYNGGQMDNREFPHWQNGTFDIDATKVDLKKKIDPAVWDMVVRSAEILQEDNDVPFERGDVIFHPGDDKLFQVVGVYDNRHRDALRCITLECMNGTQVSHFKASTVLHLSYLIQAHTPYNPQVINVTGENMDEIGQILLNIAESS